MGSIFNTLERLGMTSDATRRLFASGTRDVENLPVHIDSVSGVIFIDDFYTGTETYESGTYREQKKSLTGKPEFERHRDAARRFGDYRQFVVGRSVLDFGCGAGEFLRLAKPLAASVTGVELQEDYLQSIAADGIRAESSVTSYASGSVDTAFLFHTLEHLPDPIATLSELMDVITPGGNIVVEVPHARDFLLTQLNCEAFRNFTLWSQHLILHTRDSLMRLLREAGFTSIVVQGKQRYPLSNHLTWLADGKPGGHKRTLSAMDTPALAAAYEAALQQLDATDTLVAIASK
jgi:2-polyprenyl-3-methyl-5-hydroxy-6-metoxy-1,4-benzoquinol methylase